MIRLGSILNDTWEVKRRIGQGTFCELFLARDIIDRDAPLVAVKAQVGEIESSVIRWEGEVLKALSGLSTVPRFYYYGQHKGQDYIVMELLQGEDMSKLRNRAKAASGIGLVALPAAVYLTRQMLACIRAIHEKGFIHRDIKPANFVRRDRTGTQFCVIDFGLAKLYRDKNGNLRPKRATADFRGTTTYASPNVHVGEDQCPRDDLFSLIFVFCDLVCGKLPWTEAARDRNKHEVANLKTNLLSDPSKFVLWVHAIASSLRRPKEEVMVSVSVHSSTHSNTQGQSQSSHNGNSSSGAATVDDVQNTLSNSSASNAESLENIAGTISELDTSEEADDCNFPIEAKDRCLKIIKHLQSLSYEDTPDYDMIDQLLSECVKDHSVHDVSSMDYSYAGFDWSSGSDITKGYITTTAATTTTTASSAADSIGGVNINRTTAVTMGPAGADGGGRTEPISEREKVDYNQLQKVLFSRARMLGKEVIRLRRAGAAASAGTGTGTSSATTHEIADSATTTTTNSTTAMGVSASTKAGINTSTGASASVSASASTKNKEDSYCDPEFAFLSPLANLRKSLLSRRHSADNWLDNSNGNGSGNINVNTRLSLLLSSGDGDCGLQAVGSSTAVDGSEVNTSIDSHTATATATASAIVGGSKKIQEEGYSVQSGGVSDPVILAAKRELTGIFSDALRDVGLYAQPPPASSSSSSSSAMSASSEAAGAATTTADTVASTKPTGVLGLLMQSSSNINTQSTKNGYLSVSTSTSTHIPSSSTHPTTTEAGPVGPLSHSRCTDLGLALIWQEIASEFTSIPDHAMKRETYDIIESVLKDSGRFFECDLGPSDMRWAEFASIQETVYRFMLCSSRIPRREKMESTKDGVTSASTGVGVSVHAPGSSHGPQQPPATVTTGVSGTMNGSSSGAGIADRDRPGDELKRQRIN